MDELTQAAIDAVKKIYNDTTVDRATTSDRLTQVQEEIDLLLETLN